MIVARHATGPSLIASKVTVQSGGLKQRWVPSSGAERKNIMSDTLELTFADVCRIIGAILPRGATSQECSR